MAACPDAVIACRKPTWLELQASGTSTRRRPDSSTRQIGLMNPAKCVGIHRESWASRGTIVKNGWIDSYLLRSCFHRRRQRAVGAKRSTNSECSRSTGNVSVGLRRDRITVPMQQLRVRFPEATSLVKCNGWVEGLSAAHATAS